MTPSLLLLFMLCIAGTAMAQPTPVKIIMSEKDPSGQYVGDSTSTQLYYHILLPPGRPTATIVLLPGTWETTEHVMASTKDLCDGALARSYAVIVPSINQRLALTADVVALMNRMFTDAVQRYHLDTSTFFLGGFSMGGLFSLRYTEMAHERAGTTSITPKAVFCCDGPIDLLNIYAMFKLPMCATLPTPTTLQMAGTRGFCAQRRCGSMRTWIRIGGWPNVDSTCTT